MLAVCSQVLRVFHDRLICPEDKALVQDKLAEIIKRRWGAWLGCFWPCQLLLLGTHWMLAWCTSSNSSKPTMYGCAHAKLNSLQVPCCWRERAAEPHLVWGLHRRCC